MCICLVSLFCTYDATMGIVTSEESIHYIGAKPFGLCHTCTNLATGDQVPIGATISFSRKELTALALV